MATTIFRLRPKHSDLDGPHIVSYGDNDYEVADYQAAKTFLAAIQDAHAGGYRLGREELRNDLKRFSEKFGQ